jgi:hypothetical protein
MTNTNMPIGGMGNMQMADMTTMPIRGMGMQPAYYGAPQMIPQQPTIIAIKKPYNNESYCKFCNRDTGSIV